MPDRLQQLRNRLILQQCHRGAEEGFSALIEMYERPLYYYVRRLMEREEDCWDVLQEVWLRAFRSIRQVRDPGTLSAWLYRVTRNAAFDHRRKFDLPGSLPQDDGIQEDREEPGYDDPIARLAAMDIHRALTRMALPEREALTLYFLEGFTISEIASITGAPVGTVKSRLCWGRRHLRGLLESEECSDGNP
jgi:RNA polymerase sigma-70 factor (ECF subfamily)